MEFIHRVLKNIYVLLQCIQFLRKEKNKNEISKYIKYSANFKIICAFFYVIIVFDEISPPTPISPHSSFNLQSH